MRTVEIFAATDPPDTPNRQVWYWTEFEGSRSERTTNWADANLEAHLIASKAADVVIIDRSDKGSGYLRKVVEGVAPPDAPPGTDLYLTHPRGSVIVRVGGHGQRWLVTWLPHNPRDRDYPGFTLDDVPQGPTVEALFEWASSQPWATGVPAVSPPDTRQIEVPQIEWADVQQRAFDHNLRVGFNCEPDGSYSYAVFDQSSQVLSSGVADTWDDARLAMIEKIHPPSKEGGRK